GYRHRDACHDQAQRRPPAPHSQGSRLRWRIVRGRRPRLTPFVAYRTVSAMSSCRFRPVWTGTCGYVRKPFAASDTREGGWAVAIARKVVGWLLELDQAGRRHHSADHADRVADTDCRGSAAPAHALARREHAAGCRDLAPLRVPGVPQQRHSLDPDRLGRAHG